MNVSHGRYIAASQTAGVVDVHRLGHCPRGGWCDSSCAYSQHPTPWTLLFSQEVGPDSVSVFADRLRKALSRGNNHAIDVSRGHGANWEWIERGEDLDTPEAVQAFVSRVSDLLANGERLRLYGDDHDVSIAHTVEALS